MRLIAIDRGVPCLIFGDIDTSASFLAERRVSRCSTRRCAVAGVHRPDRGPDRATHRRSRQGNSRHPSRSGEVDAGGSLTAAVVVLSDGGHLQAVGTCGGKRRWAST